MVRINVAQQLKSPIGEARSCAVNEVTDIAGNSIPIRGEIRLMRTDRGILAKGTLHIETDITCSRCLGFFALPLSLDIEEEFFPTTDVLTGASIPLPDEPGSFTIDENNILDLTDVIRQYEVMAIPMKPLCGEDCAGLCPACGRNLNQASCDCPPEPVDPRWAELGKLVLADGEAPANEQKGTQ